MTVACVFVRGPYPYTAEYVTRLHAMVRAHLRRPFRFVCLTDQPNLFRAPIETVRIAPTLPGCPAANGYWTKVQLFNPANQLTGRVLFLDLDTLVVSDLSPLVDYPAAVGFAADELALERPAVELNKLGQTILRKFNASAMVWDVGAADALWHEWTPEVTARFQTDQDWYGHRMPEAAAMPVDWFPRISRVQPPWPAPSKVVLVKKPKNHLAAKQWPWFNAAWRGEAA